MTRPPLRSSAAALLAVGLAALAVTPAAADGPVVPPPGADGSIVVQLDSRGATIADVTRKFPVTVDSVLVRRAGIYRVRPKTTLSGASLTRLAVRIEESREVSHAVAESGRGFDSTRFHSWPEGAADERGSSAAAYANQPAAADLARAHALSRGRGIRVAVLDTGVAADHPALVGSVGPGYDYIGDDADADEEADGLDTSGDGRLDSSYGHGTFVAGLVRLVAPDAQILPMRVLDSDGVGSEVVIAQAIRDAVAAGADVINLSFGGRTSADSAAIDSALYYAENSDVLVVVSAGNGGSAQPLYPATSGDAVSVTAVDPATGRVADYASHGSWVELAAPASDVVGPVPGDGYARWSGTSMAAPLVSGQVALVQARAPRLTVDERVKVLTRTAHALGWTSARYGVTDILDSLQQAR